MVVQPGLCQTWSEILKTCFHATQLKTMLFQREELKFEEEDREDKEEEKPVIVVLKEGDLTAEEAERLQQTSTTQLDQEGKRNL